MNKRLLYLHKVWLLLVLLGSTIPISAQSSGDGYNPSNPSDPTMQLKYSLSVVSNMDGAGTVSGSGKYKAGTYVSIKATTNTGYKFLRWTLNDGNTAYKTSASFTYTTTGEDAKLTAVYEKLIHVTSKSENTNYGTATSVNTYYSKGATISLTATAKADYVFKCWVVEGDETPLSTNKTYSYTVGEEDAVIVALFDYVPGNPADPQDPRQTLKYNVAVSTNIAGAGKVTGTGRYTYSQSPTISTSANAGYAFTHWTKKVGEQVTENFSTSTSFSYPMSAMEDVEFIANYYNIAENLEENGHTLTLTSQPEGFCTFSITSGEKHLEGDNIKVNVTLATDVVFDGWYINDELQSTLMAYSDKMGNEDVELIAKCHYEPSDPNDPDAGTLGYVAVVPFKGDVNVDGEIDVTDITCVVSHIYGDTPEDFNEDLADVNGDTGVDVADISGIVSIIYSDDSQRNRVLIARVRNMAEIRVGSLCAIAGGTIEMPIYVDNLESYSSLQFDLKLPQGIQVEGIDLSSPLTKGHEWMADYVGDAYRVMGFSMTNKRFDTTSGPAMVMTLKLNEDVKEGIYNVEVQNATVSSIGEGVKPATHSGQITVGDATGINTLSQSGRQDAYTLFGVPVKGEKLSKGIYVMGGKKYVQK